jgi:hypothetical protein
MPMRQEVRPNIDIAGSIGGLGDALQQGMEFGQKRRVDKATRAALASGLTMGPDGLPDYMTAAGNILQGGGDTDTALTLARLAEAQNERQWQHNQPNWVDVGGDLYDTNSPAFRQATGRQDTQPQQEPVAPSAGDQSDYPPPEQTPTPDQTAQAGEPQPVVRGKEKPKPRRLFKMPGGQVVDEDTGEIIAEPPPQKPKSQQLPAEVGARIALGDQFLHELNVAGLGGTPEKPTPALRERIKTVFGGDVTTQAQRRAQLAAGIGEATEIWRRVETGKEALVRQLTGAGMAQSEAEQQASRYSIGPTDSVEKMLHKMDGLQADLEAVKKGAIAARSGELIGGQQDAAPPEPAPDEAAPQQAEPQQQGGRVVEMGGKRYRLMPDGTVIQLD